MEVRNRIIYCTEEEFTDFTEGDEGICVNCGNTQFCCEPDTRKYTCEDCEQNTVYCVEELLIMGKLIMTGE